MDKFVVGDVISLKSGGPDMTVREVNESGTLIAVWFSEHDELLEGSFGFKELEMGPRLV